MIELFFDVETTGLPPRNASPSCYEKYDGCRVVSIAWVLRDSTSIYSQRYSVCDPCILEKEIGAEFIHGISREIIDKYGNPIETVIHEFMDDVRKSDIIVAHNIAFDKNVVSAELYRMGSPTDADELLNHKNLCTMMSTINVVKAKNKWGSNKWPKLEELHMFLFKEGFGNAHHALADIEALSRCYYTLMEKHNGSKKDGIAGNRTQV